MYFLVATNECSSPALAGILSVIRNMLNIIGIAVPILLIVMSSINLAKMLKNPDDKKGISKIKNSFLAAIIVFFIPVFVNVLMQAMGSNTTISDCWNNASISGSNTYYELNNKKKNPVYTNPDDYQKGVKKPQNQSTGDGGDGSYTYDPIDGTAMQVGDIVWDPNDVTKISNITIQQLTALLNAHGGKARNFIPYASSLVTVEHKYSVNVFFLMGIQALESGWGTSAISRNCNNWGGVRESRAHPSNGCGSNHGGGFAYFSSVNEFNDYHAALLHNNYLTPGASHYHGPTPQGVVQDYCPGCTKWPAEVTSIANSLFKDVSKVV